MIASVVGFAHNSGGMAKEKEEGDADPRLDTTVGISITARNALAEYLGRKRKPVMKEVLSALVMQFIKAPDPVKTVLLDGVDQGMEEDYASWLEGFARRLRSGEGSDPDVDVVGENGAGTKPAHRPPGRRPETGRGSNKPAR